MNGTQDPNNPLELIQRVAIADGVVVVEHTRCSSCGHDQVQMHRFVEVIPCQKCGHRNASKAPPRALQGEVQLRHVIAAVATYQEAYAKPTFGNPLSSEELQALPERTMQLVARQSAAFARQTLDRVLSLAREMAGKEG